MIFVYINFAIAILGIVMWLLCSYKAEYIFKSRYPGMSIPKSHWSDSAISILKIILVCSCPLFNAAMLWVFIVYEEALCEKTVRKVYQKCLEAQRNDSTSCDISDT